MNTSIIFISLILIRKTTMQKTMLHKTIPSDTKTGRLHIRDNKKNL